MNDNDYCASAYEMDKNPLAYDYLKKIANGNDDALKFLWRTWNFTHVLDDLVDGDNQVHIEEAAREFILYIQELSFNPFYIKHSANIFPLIAAMFNRWCDGDEWAKSGDKHKMLASQIIKCGDIDLYLTIAYLTGGWDHMRACKEARSYDYDFEELGLEV